MKHTALACLLLTLSLTGCDPSTTEEPPAESATGAASTLSGDVATSDEAIPANMPTPRNSADASNVTLTPENTTIQFVGVHADPDKPDPRTGKFTEFTGSALVEGSTLKSVTVDVRTESLTTEIEKLTGHLKSPDFFDVKAHPTAQFASTSIEAEDGGRVKITGDLTLLDKTNSISFPATVSTEDGLTIDAKFTIDRTQFGMDYGTDNVKKEVQMTISVDG